MRLVMHEQSRREYDRYVTILICNIWDGSEEHFSKIFRAFNMSKLLQKTNNIERLIKKQTQVHLEPNRTSKTGFLFYENSRQLFSYKKAPTLMLDWATR